MSTAIFGDTQHNATISNGDLEEFIPLPCMMLTITFTRSKTVRIERNYYRYEKTEQFKPMLWWVMLTTHSIKISKELSFSKSWNYGRGSQRNHMKAGFTSHATSSHYVSSKSLFEIRREPTRPSISYFSFGIKGAYSTLFHQITCFRIQPICVPKSEAGGMKDPFVDRLR